ncbi:fibronectin type III domain-containing protein [Mesoterricola sediminis]|uniref:Fibronectin type-III domain-containing protein n=1 Tax=Mesoterricola sediminis TaxID=2927980 RepID=A0AA48KBL9_9BACT|nr:hypothetical protein [Mesoterricola sediminis]BDU75981.1 hypothetical protein METESE_09390 [Mesoterricola sediminis]
MFQNPLRTSICAALLALATLAGCSGGGGGKGSSLTAPTNFSAKWSEAYTDEIELAWTPPSQTFDGYNVEGQFGSGSFVKLNLNSLLPSTWTGASYTTGTLGLPELTALNFRMNCQRGTDVSAYSNVASVTTPLRAPTYPYVEQVGGGYKVTWYNNSAIADTLTLERGIASSSATAGTVWTPIPSVMFGATTYTDLDVPEGVYLSYRVTYAKGQASASSVGNSVQTSLSAPIDLVATPGFESVHLSWTNRSARAASVVVLRSSGLDAYPYFSVVATLAPTATTYDDLQLATGYYTYRVEARIAGATSGAPSPVAKVATLPETAPGLAVTPSLLQLPVALSGALAPDGTWILGTSGSSSMPCQINYLVGGTWAAQTFPNANASADPWVLSDASSHPHGVYTRIVMQGTNDMAFVHAWFDGSAWQSEEITRAVLPSYAPTPLTRLDANGHPVVLFMAANGGLSYAFKADNGTWTTETLASALPANANISYMALTLDASGAPAVLVSCYNGTWVLRRTGAGAWASEALPTDGNSYGASSSLAISATSDGDLHVLLVRPHYPYNGGDDLVWSHRIAGTWTLPTVLASVTTNMMALPVQVSPAGDRLVLSCPTSQGSLLVTYASGAWNRVILGPRPNLPPFLGFTSQGKVRVLQSTGYPYSASSAPMDYVLYSEQ